MIELTGKRVLITGGSSGLGLDAVKQFTKLGARVITCGRSVKKLQQVERLYPKTVVVKCDVANENDLIQLKKKVEEFGGIDILYNNAGEKQNNETTSHGKGNIFNNASKEIQTNYLAIIRLNELFIPILEKSPQPIIIITSSALAYVPSGVMPTYSASKAAVHSYAISLRLQLEKENSALKIYELMPPMVDTPFNNLPNVKKLSPDEVNNVLIKALGTDNYELKPGKTKALHFLHRFFPNRALKMLNPSK